jgi:copper chaperone CopZ
MITNTRALENVQGVESVTISLNREMLVSRDLRHSLIREEITKLKKNQMNYAVPIEVPNKEKSSTTSID